MLPTAFRGGVLPQETSLCPGWGSGLCLRRAEVVRGAERGSEVWRQSPLGTWHDTQRRGLIWIHLSWLFPRGSGDAQGCPAARGRISRHPGGGTRPRGAGIKVAEAGGRQAGRQARSPTLERGREVGGHGGGRM